MIGGVSVGLVCLPRDQVPPEAGHGDDGHDVDGVEGGQDGQEDEPEPESDVDLLIDDVQTKHTQSIVLLDGSRGTVFVKCTFCHSGEDFHHGIRSVLILHVDEVQDVSTIGHEDSTKEEVDRIHLSN